MFFKPKAKAKTKSAPSWRFCLWGLCLPAAGLLTLAARRLPGFAEGYASTVYPLLAQPLNFLTGLLPLSLMELLCGGLLLAGLALAVRLARILVHTAGTRARWVRLARALARLACAASAALLAFVLLAGINYSRSSFAALA